jgi:hypothetical protein
VLVGKIVPEAVEAVLPKIAIVGIDSKRV